MTRSEEELVVTTQQRPAGRVRLQRYVVTEDVTITVPVRKEQLRIEHEPFTDTGALDGGIGGEGTGGALTAGPEHYELVLHEEEPVITMRVVPRERVRVAKEVVETLEEIGGEVRKEQIDLEPLDG